MLRLAILITCMHVSTGGAAAQVESEPDAQEARDDALPATSSSSRATSAGTTPRPSASAPTRRPVPDYDGRGDDPPTLRERLAWIPRILLAPLYFVTEFMIRRPLAYAITRAEEVQLAERVVRFFHFGADGQHFLAPTFTFDLGFRPNVGLHFGTDDLWAPGHELRLAYSFGGASWHVASITDRYTWKSSDTLAWELGVRSRFVDRNDGRFFGTGREAARDVDARYDFLQSDTEVFLSRARTPWNTLRVATALRFRRFGEDVARDERTLTDALLAGQISALPQGFEDGVLLHATTLAFTLDSRPARPAPQSGVHLSGALTFAYSLRDPAEATFLRWDGALSAHVDLSGSAHVLSLALSLSSVENLRGQAPFTELPVLSGSGPMPGFLGELLQGPSATSLALRYHWPIWVYLDGTLAAAVGNVWDEDFGGFALDALRLSFDFGIAAVTRRDHFFELLVGFGTKPLSEGAQPDAFRFVIGGRREF